jgi:UDP-glucose 4-epimerase
MRDGVEVIGGDIRDLEALRKAAAGTDAIIHAAGLAHVFGAEARNPSVFNAVNEMGTSNVIEAALQCGVAHVILASSVSVYGNQAGDSCDETASCQPESPYAQSKWRAEVSATERIKNGRCALTILRFATIYGAADRGNVAKLIRALDRGRFVWIGTGSNRKSLIHKADAARACLLPLSVSRAETQIFNVSAQTVSMREIVALICEALGKPIPRLTVPEALIRTAGRISRMLGDPGNLMAQIEKFMREDAYSGALFEKALGFSPQIALADGLKEETMFLRRQARRAR